jgi:hypothetical protein
MFAYLRPLRVVISEFDPPAAGSGVPAPIEHVFG